MGFINFLAVILCLNSVIGHSDQKTDFNSSSNSGCCKNLYFSSTGSLAEGGQNHVLGHYNKISDGPNGYWNYQLMSGYKPKLWYNFRKMFICIHYGTVHVLILLTNRVS